MQDHEPSTFESNWSGNVVAGQWREQSASLWNFLKTDRDDVLVVREPFGDRHSPLCWSPWQWWQASDWDGPAV